MYSFFLDGKQLPIAPAKMKMKVRNTNKTITLINEGEINLLKKPGLTEISFDVLLPNATYPFAVYANGFEPAAIFLDKLEKLKISQKPFQFIVTRTKPDSALFDTNMKVTLEDYEVLEDAEEAFDIVVNVSLKQYRNYGTKVLKIKPVASGTQANNNANAKQVTKVADRPSSKTPSKSYTVKQGETLWAICKKELGNGAKYTEIAKLNNISNPNLIRPGQVIRFG